MDHNRTLSEDKNDASVFYLAEDDKPSLPHNFLFEPISMDQPLRIEEPKETIEPIIYSPPILLSDKSQPLLEKKETNVSIVLNTTTKDRNTLHRRGKKSKFKEEEENQTTVRKVKRIFNPNFARICNLSIRCAIGTLIAGMIQTRISDCQIVLEHQKQGLSQWLLFPSFYYLGGLSYAAVMVISTAGKNLGETMKLVWQTSSGICLALLWSIVLFTQITMPSISSLSSLHQVTKTSFSGRSYPIDEETFYLVLPALTFFVFIVLLIPITTNTKRFAVGMSLYFAFTVIEPNNRVSHSPRTTLKNLAVYFIVGVCGALISILTMLLPTPILAHKQIAKKTTDLGSLTLEVFNMIMDSYCFKKVSKSNLEFIDMKIMRKIEELNTRLAEIKILLEDVGWEQLFGIHWLLNSDKKALKHYVLLCGELVEDLMSMHFALMMKGSDENNVLHAYYMKALTNRLYIVQTHTCTLFQDIYFTVAASKTKMQSSVDFENLEIQLEKLLNKYELSRQRLVSPHPPIKGLTVKDYERNMSLNHLFFSLHSFCMTLVEFQKTYNQQDFSYGRRLRKFFSRFVYSFVDRDHYSMTRIVSTCKTTSSILVGMFFTVYIFNYDSTCPAAIAYVMGNHVGGSFSTTVNRVAGVVAGSVIPAIISFFICHVPSMFLTNFLANVSLFLWVVASMYVYFSGGYSAYAGYVSAFVSASILLTQCPCDGNLAAGVTYSSLAQTSVGMFIFIVIELTFFPQSALRLLRNNIQTALRRLEFIFDEIFSRHITLEKECFTSETKEHIENLLTNTLPSLLKEQKMLLSEADFEPLLWRAEFSFEKYSFVLRRCGLLLNNARLLFHLVKWYIKRMECPTELRVSEGSVDADVSRVDITSGRREIPSSGDRLYSVNSSSQGANTMFVPVSQNDNASKEQWFSTASRLRHSVKDVFNTLIAIFTEVFLSSNSEQTALYMIMKEAFRAADKDCSGEISVAEVSALIKNIVQGHGDIAEEDLKAYVDEFMELVDKDKSGQVSFEEFVNALDNGLELDMSAIHLTKSKSNEKFEKSIEKKSNEKMSIEMKTGGASIEYIEEENFDTRATRGFLEIENFLLTDIMKDMRLQYLKWLYQTVPDKENITLEQILLLNCLICGTEGIVKNLTEIEEAIAAN